MTADRHLHEQATLWVTNNYSNANHLVRTEEWVSKLKPDASEALRLAALTHDMERAFPGPDSPHSDPFLDGIDHAYNRAHAERSARIVGEFLREQAVSEGLIEDVIALICVHEDGGWPEANILQAADSLSFLEVNVSIFLDSLGTPEAGRSDKYVRAKFDWMYERIQIPEARILAEPLHSAALQRLEQQLAQ